jgi:hypothetical protein
MAVHALTGTGRAYNSVAPEFGLNWRTVRKYASPVTSRCSCQSPVGTEPPIATETRRLFVFLRDRDRLEHDRNGSGRYLDAGAAEACRGDH